MLHIEKIKIQTAEKDLSEWVICKHCNKKIKKKNLKKHIRNINLEKKPNIKEDKNQFLRAEKTEKIQQKN